MSEGSLDLECRIGTFVELKLSILGNGGARLESNVNFHLIQIGRAQTMRTKDFRQLYGP